MASNIKKLIIFDKSEGTLVGLSWKLGSRIFKSHFTHTLAASSWQEVIDYFHRLPEGTRFNEVQFWGHGAPGKALVGGEPAGDAVWLSMRPYLHDLSIVWLRVCSFAQGVRGSNAMCRVAGLLECRVIAHTHIIGNWASHSGTQGIRPGEVPQWAEADGVGDDGKFLTSAPWLPRTVAAARMDPPDWAFRRK